MPTLLDTFDEQDKHCYRCNKEIWQVDADTLKPSCQGIVMLASAMNMRLWLCLKCGGRFVREDSNAAFGYLSNPVAVDCGGVIIVMPVPVPYVRLDSLGAIK